MKKVRRRCTHFLSRKPSWLYYQPFRCCGWAVKWERAEGEARACTGSCALPQVGQADRAGTAPGLLRCRPVSWTLDGLGCACRSFPLVLSSLSCADLGQAIELIDARSTTATRGSDVGGRRGERKLRRRVEPRPWFRGNLRGRRGSEEETGAVPRSRELTPLLSAAPSLEARHWGFLLAFSSSAFTLYQATYTQLAIAQAQAHRAAQPPVSQAKRNLSRKQNERNPTNTCSADRRADKRRTTLSDCVASPLPLPSNPSSSYERSLSPCRLSQLLRSCQKLSALRSLKATRQLQLRTRTLSSPPKKKRSAQREAIGPTASQEYMTSLTGQVPSQLR